MLVVHERRRQHFVRERRGTRSRRSRPQRRETRQVGDLLDSAACSLRWHAAAEPPRMRFELARDPIAPLGVARDDEVLGEARLVFVEAAHLDRPAGAAARGEEAMAVGQRPTRRRAPAGSAAPAARPIVKGTTRPPYRNRSQRIGRPNKQLAPPVVSFASQCICFGNGKSRSAAPRSSGSVSTALLPR